MGNSIDRRDWLKKSSLALAGLGFTTGFVDFSDDEFFRPGASILLNSNENAYGPSPLARKAMLEAYLNSNRYPDEILPLLKKRIAKHWGVGEENILMGAGSSDIIGLACQHASQSKGEVVTADPSYRVWNDQASAFGLLCKRIPLNSDRKLDLPAMVNAIDGNTRMIYICNPNNPTGTFRPVAELGQHVQEAAQKTFVFIDEAYTEFAELDSMAHAAVQKPGIVVAKTFSKIYGLAGARVGYAIAHPDTIQAMRKFQYWPDASVGMVSAAAAMASLDDQDFVKDCRKKIKASREICYAAFKELSLDYLPSSTNFILFNIDKLKGNFTLGMQEKGIYVQFREHFGGKWCRVSIGTTEEMEVFVKTLKGMPV